jgi:hypothetical protein
LNKIQVFTGSEKKAMAAAEKGIRTVAPGADMFVQFVQM